MSGIARLKSFFTSRTRPSHRLRDAHRLYGMVVASARNAELFRRFDMPDSFDGRFEMLTAHLYILNDRLRRDGDAGRALSQDVFDIFIADMDAALREMAVGDQVVPKRLAKMTRVIHGRAAAYDRARFESDDMRQSLAQVISRNVFDARSPEAPEFSMADWMLQRIDVLDRMPFPALLNAEDIFGPELTEKETA